MSAQHVLIVEDSLVYRRLLEPNVDAVGLYRQ
jgi:hypothetical protein